jgi:hypothetical protein
MSAFLSFSLCRGSDNSPPRQSVLHSRKRNLVRSSFQVAYPGRRGGDSTKQVRVLRYYLRSINGAKTSPRLIDRPAVRHQVAFVGWLRLYKRAPSQLRGSWRLATARETAALSSSELPTRSIPCLNAVWLVTCEVNGCRPVAFTIA